MKIHIDLPWGGTFDIEKKPMDSDLKLGIVFGVFFICFILALGFVTR